MITFYQCLQEYSKQPGAYNFSKKDIKKISFHCRNIYERNDNQPATYTMSVEGDQTFEVRSYPDTFKRTIMGILYRRGKLKSEVPEVKPEVVKKVRTKKIIKKPAYSAKPR